MVDTKVILAILFVLGLIVSCNSIRSTNKSIVNNQITIHLNECGSYEVKNNQSILGYIVKPFVIDVYRVKEITEFEQKLRIRNKYKFKKGYRIYSFTKDRSGDTILNTIFLTSNHIKNIPNWKCELQDIDTYWQENNTVFGSKSPEMVTYNCSKKRFKVLGDPD